PPNVENICHKSVVVLPSSAVVPVSLLRCCQFFLSRCHELLLEFFQQCGRLLFQTIIQNLLLHDGSQQARIRRVCVLVQLRFKIANLIDRQVIQESTRSREDNQNLLGKGQG